MTLLKCILAVTAAGEQRIEVEVGEISVNEYNPEKHSKHEYEYKHGRMAELGWILIWNSYRASKEEHEQLIKEGKVKQI